MSQVNNIQVLDCTIRDGGYLNNWDFKLKMVRDVYRLLSRSGVDYIEIGLRNSYQSKMGIWYSTSEDLINQMCEGTDGAPIALLMDEGRCDANDVPLAEESRVKLYRITASKAKLREALDLCSHLKSKGYKVSLQLMAITAYSDKDFDRLIPIIKDYDLDYVYFADSFGSLLPEDIPVIIKHLKCTGLPIGFHPHNNLQLAFANTLTAIRHGVSIVDGTIFGMGRGAGNLPLEVLLNYFERTQGLARFNPFPVMELIDRYFIELSKEYPWGYSLPFMLSGMLSMHPNYSREILERFKFPIDKIVNTLEGIKSYRPDGFEKNLVDKVVMNGFCHDESETINETSTKKLCEAARKACPVLYKDRHQGRNFLILANGPELEKQKAKLDLFIEQYNPIILGANYLGGLFIPDYHAFSNEKRLVSYIDTVHPSSELLLSSAFSQDFVQDYIQHQFTPMLHLDRFSHEFNIIDDVITSNCRTISLLLIGVAIIMGAKGLYIAGMDGYVDHRNLKSAEKMHFYDEHKETKDFDSLIELHSWNEQLLYSINTYLRSIDHEEIHIITPTMYRSFYTPINERLEGHIKGQMHV